MNNTSKVYVLPDERGRILRCEGGYTMSNIEDISQWVLIDEGTGDRYNLCQSNYFPMPLYEEHGVPVYKLVDGTVVERTADEIAEDVTLLSQPTTEQQIIELKAQLSATDYKIIKCSEAQLVGEELPYDIVVLHEERQAIRDRINELEATE